MMDTLVENAWWMVPVAGIVGFFIFIVAILAYLVMKDRFVTRHTLTAIVIDGEGRPVSGATVSVDGKSAESDDYGKAVLSGRAGEQTVRAQEGEAYGKTTVKLYDRQVVKIRITKTGEMNEVEKAFEKVKHTYNEIGESYNKTIPAYLLSVCESIREIADSKEDMGETDRKKLVIAANKAIMRIGEGMVQRRNLTLYARTKDRGFVKMSAPSWRNMPDESEIDDKLAEMDRRITKGIGKGSFHPASILWKTAQAMARRKDKAGRRVALFLVISCDRMIENLRDYLR